jgi:uncharacterized membrane protein
MVLSLSLLPLWFELKAPKGHTLADITPDIPVFINYIMSFIYVGIYWNNHHHVMHIVHSINGAVLWANLHLLFWLSLIPFVSAWMGESHFTDPWPIALYGVVLLMNALAYTLLIIVLVRHEGKNSALATALGNDWKGKLSIVTYCIAILLSYINSYISFGLYVFIACIWFIPDKRIERKMVEEGIKD